MEILNLVFLRYYWIVESNLWVLFLCYWLEVWALLIELPQGWRRSPWYCPVWPKCTAGMHWRLWTLQHLAPKLLRQHFFFMHAFPLTLSFISLLSFHLSFFAATLLPLLPWRFALFPTFPMLCLLLFKTFGTVMPLWMLTKRQISVLAHSEDHLIFTSISILWHSFSHPLFPGCSVLGYSPLSRVTA